jgi:hypothetical protein
MLFLLTYICLACRSTELPSDVPGKSLSSCISQSMLHPKPTDTAISLLASGWLLFSSWLLRPSIRYSILYILIAKL